PAPAEKPKSKTCEEPSRLKDPESQDIVEICNSVLDLEQKWINPTSAGNCESHEIIMR
ncbi:350_t:CDS:2, partial [Rhizophagus irregularis]